MGWMDQAVSKTEGYYNDGYWVWVYLGLGVVFIIVLWRFFS